MNPGDHELTLQGAVTRLGLNDDIALLRDSVGISVPFGVSRVVPR